MRAALPYPFILLLLLACGPAPEMPPIGPLSSTVDPVLDTAAAYRTAIADQIKVLRKRDGSFPDTLYIGRHEEFPDIELPRFIEHTSVRILEPSDAEALKNGEHFAYLNIFAWHTPGQVEFFVINFGQGMRHWPNGRDDRHLRYTIGGGQEELVLDSLWQ